MCWKTAITSYRFLGKQVTHRKKYLPMQKHELETTSLLLAELIGPTSPTLHCGKHIFEHTKDLDKL